MTETKTKKSHGGAREPIKIESSQGRFLHILWRLYGGATEVSRLIGTRPQLPVNWKNRGRVPLQYVGKVSRVLGVPPELLNYEQVVAFKGKGVSWKKLVKEFKLRDRDFDFVVAGKLPRTWERILENT